MKPTASHQKISLWLGFVALVVFSTLTALIGRRAVEYIPAYRSWQVEREWNAVNAALTPYKKKIERHRDERSKCPQGEGEFVRTDSPLLYITFLSHQSSVCVLQIDLRADTELSKAGASRVFFSLDKNRWQCTTANPSTAKLLGCSTP